MQDEIPMKSHLCFTRRMSIPEGSFCHLCYLPKNYSIGPTFEHCYGFRLTNRGEVLPMDCVHPKLDDNVLFEDCIVSPIYGPIARDFQLDDGASLEKVISSWKG
ncbi:unnamed protein product [Lepeophtheirus salmonis]|uniref:(salmon louse) hypothetical protein n=1 Tax=Lepeophtheirus salmonis TaxID=72036 RepID=A0A817FFA4_LEPSM|nr:unnamed protein product [Lepeophtheirus salmonis]